MTERLTGETDGKPKVFRDSSVGNLTEFFARFQRLNIRSNADLDQLVQQAPNVVQGIQPPQLRDRQTLRKQVAGQLAQVEFSLDNLMVDRPRRNLIRTSKQEGLCTC